MGIGPGAVGKPVVRLCIDDAIDAHVRIPSQQARQSGGIEIGRVR
jgi:hypothetical protein